MEIPQIHASGSADGRRLGIKHVRGEMSCLLRMPHRFCARTLYDMPFMASLLRSSHRGYGHVLYIYGA